MWNEITDFLSFTGVEDKTVWQDVFISSFLIPIVIFLGIKLLDWWDRKRPSRLVFKDYLKKETDIYIFHSEMSSANDDFSPRENPKYITRFPQPIPTDHTRLGVQQKINIAPVSSGADSECLADIFNILGRVKKTENIYIGSLINDWNIWSRPIFSIGFNPKTHKLIERCTPIFFELQRLDLRIKDTGIVFDSFLPNDAGIVQKTFDRELKSPVFILAGLGTVGTSAAGSILKNNFVKLGKLFGANPFCVFFKVKIDEGKYSARIEKITPHPKLYRILMYPITYFHFKNRDCFH